MRVGRSKSVPHVQIEILFPIQPQDFLHHRQRHFLGRRFPSPSVKQPSKPELFITLSPVPHLPVADPRPQNDFLYFHRPLHRGLRVREHASHGLLPSPPAKRTHHLLSQPDISCANDSLELQCRFGPLSVASLDCRAGTAFVDESLPCP